MSASSPDGAHDARANFSPRGKVYVVVNRVRREAGEDIRPTGSPRQAEVRRAREGTRYVGGRHAGLVSEVRT